MIRLFTSQLTFAKAIRSIIGDQHMCNTSADKLRSSSCLNAFCMMKLPKSHKALNLNRWGMIQELPLVSRLIKQLADVPWW